MDCGGRSGDSRELPLVNQEDQCHGDTGDIKSGKCHGESVFALDTQRSRPQVRSPCPSPGAPESRQSLVVAIWPEFYANFKRRPGSAYSSAVRNCPNLHSVGAYVHAGVL